MNCFCPRCNASIAPDVAEVPTDGVFLKCPECNAGFDLQKESFANRALRSGDGITCAECGNPPGPAIYCQHCHALYPEYYVTAATSAAKKKLDKFLATLTRPKKHKALPGHYTHDARLATAPTKVSVKGVSLPVSGRLVNLVSLITILALIGGGGFYYYRDKVETEYATNYAQALSIIKITADKNIMLSTKLVNDWRTSLAPTAPRLTANEQKSLDSGRSDANILMKETENPPKRMLASRDAIKKFYDSYSRLYELNSTPPASLDSFATTAKKLEEDFRKSGRELKAGMHPKIAEAFKERLAKHKNLNDL